MAVRDDFAAGEVLAAADLNDTFASKLPYEYSDTEPTTTTDGFLWFDDNDTPPTPKFWDGSAFQAFQALTSGKILQVVRSTDGTDRTTTSTSFTDVTGVSVTISPTKSDSALILVCTFFAAAFSSGDNQAYYQITDSSNNSISGANSALLGDGGAILRDYVTLVAYATPATTSAVTYKLRFQNNGSGTVAVNGANCTTQFYALEIGA